MCKQLLLLSFVFAFVAVNVMPAITPTVRAQNENSPTILVNLEGNASKWLTATAKVLEHNGSTLRGELIIQNQLEAWLSIEVEGVGDDAIVERNEFAEFGLLGKKATARYVLTFNHNDQEIVVRVASNLKSMTTNMADLLVSFIPLVGDIPDAAYLKLLEAVANGTTLKNAAAEIYAIRKDGIGSTVGHLTNAAIELIKLATPEQIEALSNIISNIASTYDLRITPSYVKGALRKIIVLGAIRDLIKQLADLDRFIISEGINDEGVTIKFRASYEDTTPTTPTPTTPTPTTPTPTTPTPTTPTPTPNIPTPPTATGIIVKDVDDSNVERGGNPEGLYTAPVGSLTYGGHATYTYSTANELDNYVKWKPPLTQCGRWEVLAFLPFINTRQYDTANARYLIKHRSGKTPAAAEAVVVVSQDAFDGGHERDDVNRWYSLGTYTWSKDANVVGEYVQLGDLTGEESLRNVNFDDMRWVFVGEDPVACSTDTTPTTTPTPTTPTPTTPTTTTTTTPTTTATSTPMPRPRPEPEPEPTSTATLTPIPAPSDAAFNNVWSSTDSVVQQGRVSRSWMWGPAPYMTAWEQYAQSPNGQRKVEYYDKSRMEINNPNGDQNNLFYVTNGLLPIELMTGRVKTGDNSNEYEQRQAADIPVAGDPLGGNPNTPRYRSFGLVSTVDVATEPRRAESAVGQAVISTLGGGGEVGQDLSMSRHNVKIARYNQELGHNVPDVFAAYLDTLPLDALFIAGHPVSEPYWAYVRVGGVDKDVLIQVFERRVLTYTPSNPQGFKVEMGNVGQHYFQWRYGLTLWQK